MRRLIVPLACVAVAGIAVAAALLTDPPDRTERRGATVVGPDNAGVRWSSLDAPAPMRLSGEGEYWLAFRGFARGRARALSMRSPDGTEFDRRIGTEPAIHLVGPITIHGSTVYWVTPNPGGRGNGTEGQIFISGPRLFRRALAALPGSGFWPAQGNTPGAPSWLSGEGSVDVASAGAPPPRFWLTFEAISIDRGRTLTVRAGGAEYRVEVPERGASRNATVGPFPLGERSATVRFSSPGAVAKGGDSRLRSVRISELEAHPTRP